MQARADLLTELIRLGMAGDKAKFCKVVEAIIAEERAKKHTVLANKLEELLRSVPADKPVLNGNAVLDQRITNLLHEIMPERTFEDLILPEDVREISQKVVQEHHRVDLLRSYNLEPRNRVLLIDPPGNGKTTLAEAFAHASAFYSSMSLKRWERNGVIAMKLARSSAWSVLCSCKLIRCQVTSL